MRNVFDASINEKSTIEYPNFLISILKSPTPNFRGGTVAVQGRKKQPNNRVTQRAYSQMLWLQ